MKMMITPKKRVEPDELILLRLTRDHMNEKEKIKIQGNVSPNLFKGCCVFINVSNPFIRNQVSVAMEKLGAQVVSQSILLANIIISEKSISISEFKSSTIGSRNVNKIGFVPKVVLLKQIPWVFDVAKSDEFTAVKQAELNARKDAEINDDSRIVVADDRHKYRPEVKIFKKGTLPELHIQRVFNHDYINTPFSPVPENVDQACKRNAKSAKKNVELNNNPPENGYCEVCQTRYNSAAIHHSCFDHRRNSNSFRWCDFDSLANFLNRKCMLCKVSGTSSLRL